MMAERGRPEAWDESFTGCSREELLTQAVEVLKTCRAIVPVLDGLDPIFAELNLVLTDRACPVPGRGVALGARCRGRFAAPPAQALPVLAQAVPSDSDMGRAAAVLCTRLPIWREEVDAP